MLLRNLYPAPQPLSYAACAEADQQDQPQQQQQKQQSSAQGPEPLLPLPGANKEKAVADIASESSGPLHCGIAFMGLDNAGKTTLMRLLKEDRLTVNAPTQHAEAYEACVNDFRIKIHDLGGHEAVRCLWKQYGATVDGIAFLVDASDWCRFPEARSELWKLLGEQAVDWVPVAVLAQKMDLPLAASAAEFQAELGLADLGAHGRSGEVEVFECSSVQKRGYTEAICWLSIRAPAAAMTRTARASAAREAEKNRRREKIRQSLPAGWKGGSEVEAEMDDTAWRPWYGCR